MSKLGVVCLLAASLCVALAWAEPRHPQSLLLGRSRQLQRAAQQPQHPYIFLTIPQGRANAGSVVQGFEIVEELDDADLDREDREDVHNDADGMENDREDDDDDDEEEVDELEHQLGLNFARSGLIQRRNKAAVEQELEEDDAEQDDDQEQEQEQLLPKKTQMMVARDQAGAIMVPDGIIEIEGQSVLDEKTGKAALLVPRAALDAIPDGAVVALMERSAASVSDSGEVAEERANRVVVRRRKNNGRRNIRRRGTNTRRRRPVQRRRRGGNRGGGNGNRRRNVRVIRPNGGGNQRRRGGNQRRRGQVAFQG